MLSYGEWKAQIKFMLASVQSWLNAQQSHFVIGASDSEVRREVVILAEEQRSTPASFFKHPDGLYDGNTPSALLRGMLFDCRKYAREIVWALSLYQQVKD